MNVGNLLKRLQKLESNSQHKSIVFKMADGSIKKLPHKDFLEVCGQAIYGVTSPQTDIASNAVSCNETGRLLELMHMCIE